MHLGEVLTKIKCKYVHTCVCVEFHFSLKTTAVEATLGHLDSVTVIYLYLCELW